MNHITLLRIMLVVGSATSCSFHTLIWTYAVVTELEWWCQFARVFVIENQAILEIKGSKKPPELSENE